MAADYLRSPRPPSRVEGVELENDGCQLEIAPGGNRTLRQRAQALVKRGFGGVALGLLGWIPDLPAQSGLDAPVAVGAYLNGAFPAVAPGSSGGWTTTNAFPHLTFVDPIWIAPYPGTNDLVVAEKTGRIYRFPNNPATLPAARTLLLDWTAQVQTSEDQGLYSFAFHPEFGQAVSPNRGYLYVCYSQKTNLGGYAPNQTFWRVVRFTIPDGSTTVDAASAFVLIHQYDPHRWHQGGAMFFSVAGLLYISVGDGGEGDDHFDYSQRIDFGLFGGVLRIDVDMIPSRSGPIRRQPLDDHPIETSSYTQGYGIPFDNPFVQSPAPPTGVQANRLEEFCAIGLRSPHSMHYDRDSGQVWIGDVGQDFREELDLFVIEPAKVFTPGGAPNFQWPFLEGFRFGPKSEPAIVLGQQSPPVYEFPRADVGSAIIGGFPYRGNRFAAELGGHVLFGDHVVGTISAFDQTTQSVAELLDSFDTGSKIGLAHFCTDANGEVLIPNLNGTNTAGGTIHQLAKTLPTVEPPALLSETGAFANITSLEPAEFLVPFDVNTPLWSDRAAKHRWIAVPNDGTHDTPAEKITFSETGNWMLPAGTALVKHFELPIDERSPHLTRPLETRFIICTAGGGRYGVTYRWRADLSDADLISNRETADIAVIDSAGANGTQTWTFPSRADCLRCHNPAAGQALGVRTQQLNGDASYPATGRTANQLRTWNALGMFDVTLSDTQINNFLRSTRIDDETVPVEHRVRSYLDANCAHCHQPGASGPSFDARLFTPLDAQQIVNGEIDGYFNLGTDGLMLKPRDIALSAIHARMQRANPDPVAMPPLAKGLVDTSAVALLERWITSLDPAEFGAASFARLIADSEANGNPWTSVAELNLLDAANAIIPQTSVALVSVDSEELIAETHPGSHAIDGNSNTFWHTPWQPAIDPPHPHTIVLDLGSTTVIGGFKYQPRLDSADGRIKDWRFEISSDGTRWIETASGTFANGTTAQTVSGLATNPGARVLLGGPQDVSTGLIKIVIVFGTDVTGLTMSDIAVTGGSVVGLTGSRHYYTATIQASGPVVDVSLLANQVTSAGGSGNIASAKLSTLFGTAFATWASSHGLVSPADEFLADSDGDGQVTFLEYLFNLDPTRPDHVVYDPATAPGALGPVGLPRITVVTGVGGDQFLRIEYLQRRLAADLGFTYVAQFTGDLAGALPVWTDRSDGTATIIDAEWESVEVVDTVPITNSSTRFGRLKLTSP